jgi:hypothetical protein
MAKRKRTPEAKSKQGRRSKKKKRFMAAKMILAVAIADHPDETRISSWKSLRGLRRMKIRPYLRGLVQGLDELNERLGEDYVIHFRQRDAANLNAAAFRNPEGGPYVIVCMSTTVVKAAAAAFPPATAQPIVGVVSEPVQEQVATTANLCGITARRVQTADNCFRRFVRAVPTLTEVKLLHKAGYGPSDRARDKVQAAANAMRNPISISDVPVTTAAALMTALQSLPQRDLEAEPPAPATVGVLVLPVDVCLGHAQEIIDYVQQDRGLPTFFPVPDWVRPDASGALGAYGLSQRRSGALMAQQVKEIWDAGDVVPNFATVNDRWIPASRHEFEFLVSTAVADELNIRLKRNIPRV